MDWILFLALWPLCHILRNNFIILVNGLDFNHKKYVSEPHRGRVSAELSKPVERKGAMCVVLV